MDVGRFYSSRKLTTILTTFRETAEVVAESSNVTSVVVLPPDARDFANDSDIEDVPEELQNEVPFEAAGEFQLEEIASENEDDINVEVKERVKPGQKRKCTSTVES